MRCEAAGPHVRIAVADTGPGIPPDVVPKIFEPLFTTKSFGTGLGLPTVRKVVEQHGGTIDVASVPDQGSTFTIWLPRQAAPAQTGATARPRPEIAGGSGRALGDCSPLAPIRISTVSGPSSDGRLDPFPRPVWAGEWIESPQRCVHPLALSRG